MPVARKPMMPHPRDRYPRQPGGVSRHHGDGTELTDSNSGRGRFQAPTLQIGQDHRLPIRRLDLTGPRSCCRVGAVESAWPGTAFLVGSMLYY